MLRPHRSSAQVVAKLWPPNRASSFHRASAAARIPRCEKADNHRMSSADTPEPKLAQFNPNLRSTLTVRTLCALPTSPCTLQMWVSDVGCTLSYTLGQGATASRSGQKLQQTRPEPAARMLECKGTMPQQYLADWQTIVTLWVAEPRSQNVCK